MICIYFNSPDVTQVVYLNNEIYALFYVSCIYEECDHCIHCMKRNMRGVFCSLYRHIARMNHQSTVILSFLSYVVLYILFVKINDVRKYNIPTACDHWRQLTTNCLLPFVFMNGSVWCKDDQNLCHVKDIHKFIHNAKI